MQMQEDLGEWAIVEALYESSLKHYGVPVELRLFDPQFSENLNEEWLAQAAERYGITFAEIQAWVTEGLLKKWPGPNGATNFTLYSEKQAQVIKNLLSNPRLSKEEVDHVVDEWNSYLEMVREEPPYDDMDTSDYLHFQRRASEMVEVFRRKSEYSDAAGNSLGEDGLAQVLAEQREKLAQWELIRDLVDSRSEAELPEGFQKAWKKVLFRLRFADEFIRIQSAHRMVVQLEEGYSPEVEFDGWSQRGSEVTLTHLNWRSTLVQWRRSRIEGNRFPLRTPVFNLTEHGLELICKPSPAEYEALFTEYRLDELFNELERMGDDLWEPALVTGTVACPQCGTSFVRKVVSKVYCTDVCRARAKSQRYRDRDPERARLNQARYWSTYGGDLLDDDRKP
jgi:DNA-binding transcriptional MerR regulator